MVKFGHDVDDHKTPLVPNFPKTLLVAAACHSSQATSIPMHFHDPGRTVSARAAALPSTNVRLLTSPPRSSKLFFPILGAPF